jgi:hypothetical protein
MISSPDWSMLVHDTFVKGYSLNMSGTHKPIFASCKSMQVSIKSLMVLGSILLLSACSGTSGPVKISQDFPTPLVIPLDYKVGVYYSPEFRKYRYVDSENSLNFELGSRQTNLFSRVFSAMFTDALRIEDPGVESTIAENLDLILMPVLEEYAFLSPQDQANQFYAVSIKYHIRVYNADKELIGFWPFIAYGKNRGGLKGSDSPLGDATDTALRDAAAALVTQFRDVVDRKDWQPPRTDQQESSR